MLTDPIGAWQRLDSPVAGDPALLSAIPSAAQELLQTYSPVCGAQAAYRNTAGPGEAEIAMLAFGSVLDALGFYAAQRTQDAEQVLLTSAAYRDAGVLHVHSGWYYLRVEAVGGPPVEKDALPADQYLASRLEVRLPQQLQLPRVLRIMPRGWVTPMTVGYAPTESLGGELRPMAAMTEALVGEADVRVQVMEARDLAEARVWYTRLLEVALEEGEVREAADLGVEGYFTANGGRRAGMLQDQFVAHLWTNGTRLEAEAIMRLVGTAIRITRPLPGDEERECPPMPQIE
ncbi:MAG TPA: hypothetical protein DEP45_03885 [Armatimonadetes bacterium]|nr:hypothetical protein [Armatimonadota bacterium]